MQNDQTQETIDNSLTAFIDADPLAYIIGWNFRENPVPKAMTDAVDSMLCSMLTFLKCTHYLGAFSDSSSFRKTIYKYALYKGNRPEKPEWYKIAEPVISVYLQQQWGFLRIQDGYEADDVLSIMARQYRIRDKEYIICSPDKDMKQVPGLHYDFRKENNDLVCISKEQGEYNLLLQMLTGDDTDNVAGVPGLGIVKATKLLAETEPVMHKMVVRNAYCKYFGSYYGNEIFDQTLATLTLMSMEHPLGTGMFPSLESISLWYQCIKPFDQLSTGMTSPFEQLRN